MAVSCVFKFYCDMVLIALSIVHNSYYCYCNIQWHGDEAHNAMEISAESNSYKFGLFCYLK